MSMDILGSVKQVDLAKKAGPELEKLKKATDDFEAVFLKKLFSQMRSTVEETKVGQSFGKEIYQDMFDEAMANAAAKSKTLGMGEMLYKQFAPRIVEGVQRSGMSSLGMRRTSSLLVDEHNGLQTGKHDLAGRGTHEQAAHATSKTDLTTKPDLGGQAPHRQDADATQRKS